MKKFIVQANNIRLDKYLKSVLPGTSQAIIEKLVRKKIITLDEKRCKSSNRVNVGQVICINSLIEAREIDTQVKKSIAKNDKLIKLIEKSIIYEDENIIAINKPFGLAVQSGTRVHNSIDKLIKNINNEIRVVHRLDKHTTGVLIFAKNLKTTTELWNIFKNRLIKKRYLAIVVGVFNEKCGQIKNFIKKAIISNEEIMQCSDEDVDLAITNFKTIEQYKNAALIELSPETGRKHQLRVHMDYIGHPILGDGKYGRKKAFLDECDKKMNLHASSVEFNLFNEKINIKAENPQNFQSNLSKISN